MSNSEGISQRSGQREEQPEKVLRQDDGLPRERHWPGGRNGHGRNNFRYPLSTKSPTGRSWIAMMNRCYNENRGDFKYYGGAGIRVCLGLQSGPQALAALLGTRPSDKTIDRLNGSLSYTCGQCAACVVNSHPMNLRWATSKEQRINQARNRFIEINGVTKTAMEWANECGVNWSSFYMRLRLGWTGTQLLGRTLSPREGGKKRSFTLNGETKGIGEWCEARGIRLSTVTQRLARGWTFEQALRYPPNASARLRELDKTHT